MGKINCPSYILHSPVTCGDGENWYEIIYILQGSLRFVKRELSFNILIKFDIPINQFS
jgi:hypothetical protein